MNKSKKTCKTPSRETGCIGKPDFTGCLSIQFFNSTLALAQSVRPPMATYPSLCSPCDLQDAMPRHWSPGASHPPCHPSPSRGLLPGFYTHFILSAQPSADWFATYPHHPFFYCERYGFESAYFIYLGKWRISLGVISILSMYLRIHT